MENFINKQIEEEEYETICLSPSVGQENNNNSSSSALGEINAFEIRDTGFKHLYYQHTYTKENAELSNSCFPR